MKGDNVPFAVCTLLKIKDFAIQEDGLSEKSLSYYTGCGKLVITHRIDDVINALITRESRIADLEHQLAYTKDSLQDYQRLGFIDPDSMDEQELKECRELAAAQEKRREADEV